MAFPTKNYHFNISERKILLRIMDIAFVLFFLYIKQQLFGNGYFRFDSSKPEWILILGGYLTVFATVFEMYDLQKIRRYEAVIASVVLTSSCTVFFYLLTPFYTPELPGNRLQIVYFFLIIVFALLLWRMIYNYLIAAPQFTKRALLIAETNPDSLIEAIHFSDPNFKIVKILNTDGIRKEFFSQSVQIVEMNQLVNSGVGRSFSEIIVATPLSDKVALTLNQKFITLSALGIPIREYKDVYEELTGKVALHTITGEYYRFLPFSRRSKNKMYLFYSRFLDYSISVLGLLFGIAMLPFILTGNLIGNRGPLFYSQIRVGKNEKLFKIYKLRSMIADAEKTGVQYANPNDSRVTRFGRFLRRSRIDEIPQFINILKGDMSLIGPRPERPEFTEKLKEDILFYEMRHLVRPGITGWAQVNTEYGSSKADSYEKLQYDLYYLKHRGFFLDAGILFKTLSTVLFYRGQ